MVDTPVTTAKARKIKLVQATGLPPEYEDGVPPRTGYNDEVIEELRKKAIELAAQGEDVDPTPIPEGTYKTDKEKLGIAVHKYTPTAAKKEPGVHRLH